jgi:ribose/xylose/arabinose/galactoside ABC-type transport system permease subunit
MQATTISMYNIGVPANAVMAIKGFVVIIVIFLYAFSGFCSALAGAVFMFFTQSGYAWHGDGPELDAIAAVVIGGTLLSGGVGYVAGTMFGVLLLGAIQSALSSGNINSWWLRIIIGILIFVFCLIQKLFDRKQN